MVTARAPVPAITTLSISSGAVGATVTITGTGFGALQAAGTVSFNGVVATASSWSARSIVTTVPVGATTGNVIVAQGGWVSVGTPFTVTSGTGVDCTTTTCFFIQPNGTASQTGAGACISTGSGNWTNAGSCAQLPATLTRNAVYLFADCTGTSACYSTRAYNTATSGTQTITFQKAIPSDHGPATGWVDTMGDGQAIFGQMEFNTQWFVVDGKVGGFTPTCFTKNCWTGVTVPYGFKIINSSHTIFVNGGCNISLRHIETQGVLTATEDDSMQLFNTCNGSTTIDYAYFHDSGRCPFFFNGSSTLTASYVFVGSWQSTAGEHSEVAVLRSEKKFIFRWGIVSYGSDSSTGGFISASDGVGNNTTAELYGSIFYNDPAGQWYPDANNGFIASMTCGGETAHMINWKVYNNTVIFRNAADSVFITNSGCTPTSGNVAQNNLFYQVVEHNAAGEVGWSESFDHFIQSGAATGTNTSTGTTDPFVGVSTYDWHTTAGTPAGTPLASPYNVDMFGCTRNTPTRGAVEFPAC